MCSVCGCGEGDVRIDLHRHAHEHDHDHDHSHDHGGQHADGGEPRARRRDGGTARIIAVEQDILAKNARFADANRIRLAARRVVAVNLMSSPGSGKTTLLEATIRALGAGAPVAVIEGDQHTTRDAERIRAAGARAIQVNTGKGCHLDAHMVGHAFDRLDLPEGAFLFIENVGNLVCPAAFDLGEARRAVVLSVTEGEDKPLKYPDMFAVADVMVLNKADLLPHVEFDVARAIADARRVNPAIEAICLSARTGDGLADWIGWLERLRPEPRTLSADRAGGVSAPAS